MPDLATHLAAGYLGVKSKQGVSQGSNALFLAGNLLPDLLTRPFYTLFPRLYWLFAPLHTPVGLLLVCGLISYTFEERLRGMAFRALVLGAGLHLLLDALQKRVVAAYGILFPFAWRDLYVGLFWADESFYLLALLLIVLIGRRLAVGGRRILSPEAK